MERHPISEHGPTQQRVASLDTSRQDEWHLAEGPGLFFDGLPGPSVGLRLGSAHQGQRRRSVQDAASALGGYQSQQELWVVPFDVSLGCL